MEGAGDSVPCNVSLTSEEPIYGEDKMYEGEGGGEETPNVIYDQSDSFKEPSKDLSEAPPVPLVLEPDHPMMERFQAALKKYLLKQLDRLSNQVYELDSEIKKKEKEREETGLQLYTMQQEIYKQQKTLESCESATESLMKERQSLEESLRLKKDNRKEEINCLNCIKKKENDLITEYQKLSALEKQMEKWQKDMESELNVSQRISEKTQYDKNKLIEEKRQMIHGKRLRNIMNSYRGEKNENGFNQLLFRTLSPSYLFQDTWVIRSESELKEDMYLLRLMTAVSNYESDYRLLESEIDVKLEEKDALNQTLADANADLQALISEQKRLLTAWNSVVSTINFRNTVFVNLSKELDSCQEGFNTLNAEIESYKRSAAEEMKRSEKLAILYSRYNADFEKCEANLKVLMNKKVELENKLTSIAAMINRTEAECQISKLECAKTENDLKNIRTIKEKIHQKKRFMEDEIFKFLQEQMINDKSAIHLNKLIKEKRELSRKQEVIIAETENKISQKFLQVEELKEITIRNNEIIKEMNSELSLLEEELKMYETEINKCQSATLKKQGNYAALVRKIEKHLEKTAFSKGLSNPLQMRITELEKTNAETQAKNDKLQSLWLMHQSNNMKLTEERNEQIKDISLLRRKVMLLEQKALKINLEYEKEKKIQTDLSKSISRLQHKVVVLNEIFVGKKGYKENLGKENMLVQAQFVQNLKDMELEQIRLKAEIKDLEASLEELAEIMLGMQREMLAWEKKIQSAVEAKTEMQKEKSSSGDMGQMKAEIHRMEVRYSHLKRAQEKLITDLEQCVIMRDAISDNAAAKEKRQAQGFNTRYMLQKKIEGVKNQIRTVRSEHKQIEKLIQNSEKGQQELKKVISQKEAEIMQMEETSRKMDEQLEEGKLQKVSNLEMLIRRQKKCKMYETIKSGKYRMLYKGEGMLESELQKTKNTNSDLVSVMEALIEDFPGYRFRLKKIYNTFHAGPS